MIQPKIDANGIPLCDDRCPSHDGKRCEETGFRPDRICEPAVAEIANELVQLRRNLSGEIS